MTNFLPKLVHMLLFSTEKKNWISFLFFNSLFSGVVFVVPVWQKWKVSSLQLTLVWVKMLPLTRCFCSPPNVSELFLQSESKTAGSWRVYQIRFRPSNFFPAVVRASFCRFDGGIKTHIKTIQQPSKPCYSTGIVHTSSFAAIRLASDWPAACVNAPKMK